LFSEKLKENTLKPSALSFDTILEVSRYVIVDRPYCLKASQVYISDDVEMHVNDFMTRRLGEQSKHADNRYSEMK